MKKIFLLLMFLIGYTFADIGKITVIKGEVEIQRGTHLLTDINSGTSIKKKDIIKTKDNGKLQLLFQDKTVINLGHNSNLNVSEYLFENHKSKADFSITKGIFKIITGKIGKINPTKFTIKTSSANIGIRGTVILGNQNIIAFTQGWGYVESNGVIIDVETNYMVTTKKGQAPSLPELITQEILKKLDQETKISSYEPATEQDNDSIDEWGDWENSDKDITVPQKKDTAKTIQDVQTVQENIKNTIDSLNTFESDTVENFDTPDINYNIEYDTGNF